MLSIHQDIIIANKKIKCFQVTPQGAMNIWNTVGTYGKVH